MSAENMAPNIVQVIRSAVDRLPDSEAAQLDEASKTVYALVEALKKCSARLEVHMIHTEDLIAHMESTAALRAAGVDNV